MSDFLVVSGGRTILVGVNPSWPVTVLVTFERLFRVLYYRNALVFWGRGWQLPALVVTRGPQSQQGRGLAVCCNASGQCGASSLSPAGCSVILSERPGTSIVLQRKKIQSGLGCRKLRIHYFLFPSLHFRRREMVYFLLKMCLVALVVAAVYFEGLLTAEK